MVLRPFTMHHHFITFKKIIFICCKSCLFLELLLLRGSLCSSRRKLHLQDSDVETWQPASWKITHFSPAAALRSHRNTACARVRRLPINLHVCFPPNSRLLPCRGLLAKRLISIFSTKLQLKGIKRESLQVVFICRHQKDMSMLG